MTFSLLYARFGDWKVEDHATKQGAIDAAIDGSEFGQIFPLVILDRDAKTFEVLKTSGCWDMKPLIALYLSETMGDQFSFAGDLWIEQDDDDE